MIEQSSNPLQLDTTDTQRSAGCAPTPCSADLWECCCFAADPHDVELSRCSDCNGRVWVCLGCYVIRRGCKCGVCTEGSYFEESEE